MQPVLTWNLVEDVRQMFQFPFMVNAFRAGTIVAVLAGLVGWFMVLRRQSFAGHTLAVVGFPGAAGAVLLGVSATYGLLTFAVAAALVIAAIPGSRSGGYSEESAVTGTVQAFALACGFLFLSLHGGQLGGVNNLLFGSFLGITAAQVQVLAVIAVVAVAILAAIARPLLFASVDPDVAAARGVPVRALGAGFLVLLGVAAGAAAQITGSLLVFALLVAPAATAQLITARPVVSAGLAVLIGVLTTWASLFVAYYLDYPIGFFITSIAFAGYLLVAGGTWARGALAGDDR
ncbi:metal ABC transporter permease [Rhodococcus sp. X156]|uniref:metal ABC transporter permease n=1 Tax=Rhodococcus sp. X156 TaxID=2499145 RepID=UPI000FDACD16|nr:metal ABC transporter permease [Rhodococcus sp. X156]